MLIETCQRLGLVDPAELHRYPDHVVRRHLWHTYNGMTGRYRPSKNGNHGRQAGGGPAVSIDPRLLASLPPRRSDGR